MTKESFNHLTYEERCHIYVLLKRGISIRAIGREIKRPHTTVSREIARNKSLKGYRMKHAQEKAEKRRCVASSIPRKLTADVISLIKEMLLDVQASPEQIRGRLKTVHQISISHESIYRFIWKDKKAGGDLYKHLRQRAKKRNKRSGKNAGRGLIPNRVDIDQRPKIVEEKTRIGDFELDTIVGANHRGAIVSIVDRASKYTYLALLPKGTAEGVLGALCQKLHHLADKRALIHTFTSDNGKEFAAHEKIVERLGGAFYFATPYHSWERGLNEHTNGLVRQYFPKGTDFTTLTQEKVAVVERKINNRPRKVLDYLTPAEAFFKLTSIDPGGGALQC